MFFRLAAIAGPYYIRITIKYLIYLSTSIDLLSEEQIHTLLAKSRANNAADNLTGVLLYHEGNFIQLLEGEAEKVDSTFDRISDDPSHKNIIVIAEGDLDERSFGDWSMGFQRATAKEFADVEAYTDPKQLEDKTGNEDHPALKIC